MEVGTKIQELSEAAQKRVEEAQGELDSAEKQQQDLVDLAKQIDSDLAAAKKAEYDRGFAEGKASIVLPDPTGSDKIYSQAEVSEIVTKVEAKKEQEKMDALDAAKKEADEALEVEKKRADENEEAAAERDQLKEASANDKQAMDKLRVDVDALIESTAEVVTK